LFCIFFFIPITIYSRIALRIRTFSSPRYSPHSTILASSES